MELSSRLRANFTQTARNNETQLCLKTTHALGADTNGNLKSAAVAGGLNSLGDVGNILSKVTKMATNPTKEQIFKDVDFRTQYIVLDNVVTGESTLIFFNYDNNSPNNDPTNLISIGVQPN